ncbi:MAG: hypothetical protein GX030_09190 [Firmicutes bacterium]|nr:hypothetical protein [Bacillota bacterium]
MRSAKYRCGLILSVFFVLVLCEVALGVGVQPLAVDFDLRPGQSARFTLRLTPTGEEELIHLSIYRPVQLPTGSFAFEQGDPESFPASRWVKLPSQPLRVAGNQPSEIEVQVSVPFGVSGSHVLIIMVEPQPVGGLPPGGLRIRYAVRVVIRVPGPADLPRANLDFLRLEQDEAGDPVFVAQVSNPSSQDYPATVELTIRDENHRLVERLALRTLVGHQNNEDATRIYPGAKVLYTGSPRRPLAPGTYHLRALLQYAERGQGVINQSINIQYDDSDLSQQAVAGQYITLDREAIEARLRPRQRQMEPLTITNLSPRPLYAQVKLESLPEGGPLSVADFVTVYGPELLPLRSTHPNRIVLSIQIPPNAVFGHYRGVAKVIVYTDQTLTEVLEEQRIPIEVFVGHETAN